MLNCNESGKNVREKKESHVTCEKRARLLTRLITSPGHVCSVVYVTVLAHSTIALVNMR